MTLFFLEKPEVNGIFNVGSGLARTWNDLAAALFLAMGQPLKIEYVHMPESLRPRYQYFTMANMDKFRASGFDQPCHSLEEAVADYVKNYLIPNCYLESV